MIESTSRSRFVAGSLAGTWSFAVLRAPARSAQFNYKASHDFAKADSFNVRVVQMARAIAAETSGRLVISVFPESQLGSTAAQFSQVRLGAIDFMFNSGAQFGEVVPVAEIENTGFAFARSAIALQAMDGALGSYIKRQIEAAGLVVMPRIWSQGLRQTITATRPIRAAADLEGIKLRIPPSKIFLDLFRTLGAAPIAVNAYEIYTAMQTRLVDGAELPLSWIETYHYSEVQKYLSITNHIWAGKWMIMNKQSWSALPSDLQAAVVRNATKYALLERRDYDMQESALRDKLGREGLAVNQSDRSTFVAKLGPYYTRWKNDFGATAWGLLEAATGKLV